MCVHRETLNLELNTRTDKWCMYEHTNDGRHVHAAHLVDVFEFVYDLADDRLGGLVTSGLGAGVRSLQAGPGEPDRTGGKNDSVLVFHWI